MKQAVISTGIFPIMLPLDLAVALFVTVPDTRWSEHVGGYFTFSVPCGTKANLHWKFDGLASLTIDLFDLMAGPESEGYCMTGIMGQVNAGKSLVPE